MPNDRPTWTSLDGQLFSAADVMKAAGITQHTLTNYLSKTSLELCSTTLGQGRARRYCLIDVYQISLLARLSRLIKSVAWVADALNYLLFVDWETREFIKVLNSTGTNGVEYCKDDIAIFKRQLCSSISSAPEPYTNRDLLNPTFLIISESDVEIDRRVIRYENRDGLGYANLGSPGVAVWSSTQLLSHVDQVLIDTKKEHQNYV